VAAGDYDDEADAKIGVDASTQFIILPNN